MTKLLEKFNELKKYKRDLEIQLRLTNAQIADLEAEARAEVEESGEFVEYKDGVYITKYFEQRMEAERLEIVIKKRDETGKFVAK